MTLPCCTVTLYTRGMLNLGMLNLGMLQAQTDRLSDTAIIDRISKLNNSYLQDGGRYYPIRRGSYQPGGRLRIKGKQASGGLFEQRLGVISGFIGDIGAGQHASQLVDAQIVLQLVNVRVVALLHYPVVIVS